MSRVGAAPLLRAPALPSLPLRVAPRNPSTLRGRAPLCAVAANGRPLGDGEDSAYAPSSASDAGDDAASLRNGSGRGDTSGRDGGAASDGVFTANPFQALPPPSNVGRKRQLTALVAAALLEFTLTGVAVGLSKQAMRTPWLQRPSAALARPCSMHVLTVASALTAHAAPGRPAPPCGCRPAPGGLLWAPLAAALLSIGMGPSRKELEAREAAVAARAEERARLELLRRVPVTPAESADW